MPQDPADPYDSIVWDGLVHSYRPGPDWRTRVPPALPLSTDHDDALDPVTFEVLRHRLWTINIAHGDTLVRMSGSPIFQAQDFTMSLLTEDGEIVMSAPFIQYLAAGAPLVVRYLMEHFGERPGIADGDVFLASDPGVNFSGYFLKKPGDPSVREKEQYDPATAEKLWNKSLELIK